MATLTFSDIVKSVAALPKEDQDALFDIVRKRRAEARRKELAADIREARRNYRAGRLKSETVDEVIDRLHRSLDEPI